MTPFSGYIWVAVPSPCTRIPPTSPPPRGPSGRGGLGEGPSELALNSGRPVAGVSREDGRRGGCPGLGGYHKGLGISFPITKVMISEIVPSSR